ncbi:PDZ/DHR/GLGF domain protein [Thermobaculum terrenum ATCC BAA-798]|uniref:PDZ/DHR/GLGF domain protein n=1 Tax=Thermobaculum terrenum (strain ATCC BAA-798 / CCMEE 7001 / YNP1) TaxID=525904 RepID=D1CC35_THET1|nr:PDZ domain-containing protein [Thermobaculum terrenum]ACZ42350.1 PDZ/DHR/GLGF domain protein [Thermobaculum terrenum ATCC BAA-798]
MVELRETDAEEQENSDKRQPRFTYVSIILLLIGALVFGALAGGMAGFALSRRGYPTTTSGQPLSQMNPADVVKSSEPYMVTITTPTSTEQGRGQRTLLGNGVVMNLDGYILTTSQVLQRYDQVQVVFYDGRSARGVLVAAPDQDTGLAVVKVSVPVPKEPVFADPNSIETGTQVIALGISRNGAGVTADMGIIGSIGFQNNIGGAQMADNLIWTDAKAPEVALGGPVVNLAGEIIGITVAVDNRGWSLVLPANTARNIAQRLLKTGAGPRASLGIYYVTVTPQLAQLRGLDQSGALITAVLPDSPADRAGLKPGDLIISLDGKVVNEKQTLESLLAAKRPGETVHLQVIRKGTVNRYTVLLARKPAPGATPTVVATPSP